MKSKLAYFFAGIAAAVMLLALPIGALASDGSLTLTVFPIRVLVNGEVFQPRDANGDEVMVFTCGGTTYAPVRALAEAYGLEVGYDSEYRIATVNGKVQGSDEGVSFCDLWTVVKKPVTNYGDEEIYTATYNGPLGMQEFKGWWKSLSGDDVERWAEGMAADAQALNPACHVTMYFDYGGYMLGTAYAFGDLEQSNFRAADIWVK